LQPVPFLRSAAGQVSDLCSRAGDLALAGIASVFAGGDLALALLDVVEHRNGIGANLLAQLAEPAKFASVQRRGAPALDVAPA
jgi:hypothetical protein